MTQFITEQEYRALGGSIPESVTGAALNKFLQRASIKLDQISGNRIVSGRATSFQLDLLKQATVEEADYLYNLDQTGLDPTVASFSVPDITVAYTVPLGSARWYKENQISQYAVELLDKSGLTWRGL